jgi:integrase
MTSVHPRLSEAVEDYLDLRRARFSHTTVQNETFVLRRFVANVGDIQVRHLRPEHVEKWFYGPGGVMAAHRTRDRLAREPVQASTHNYYRSRLKSFFGYCSQRGLTRAVLLQQVTPMRLPTKDRLQPGPDTLWIMLDGEKCPRDRAILATAMNTGLRSSSISDLRVGDVDLDNLTLHVRITKSKIEDSMPMTSDLAMELRHWLVTYRTDCIESETPVEVLDEHYLFPAKRGPRYRWRTEPDGRRVQYQVPSRWRPDGPARKIHEVAQAALYRVGLPTTHEGIHTIRRAVARLYFDRLVADGGYDGALRQVSSLLHHSNSTTTERYLGLSRERRARDESLRGKSLLGPRPGASSVTPINGQGATRLVPRRQR